MIDQLTKLWESKFDHIYLRWYVKYKERYDVIIEELNRIGLYQARNFSVCISTPTEFDHYIYEGLINDHKICETLPKGLFPQAWTFYKLLNEIYLMKYNNVLLLDDDIKFIKDLNVIKDYLEKYDRNIDCCLFDYINCVELNIDDVINNKYKNIDNYYISPNTLWANTCGAYSHRFIKYLLNCHNIKLGGPDYYLNWGYYDNSIIPDVYKEINDNISNYVNVITIPRLCIQGNYKNKDANFAFDGFDDTQDQYQQHFVQCLNKDINYSNYR